METVVQANTLCIQQAGASGQFGDTSRNEGLERAVHTQRKLFDSAADVWSWLWVAGLLQVIVASDFTKRWYVLMPRKGKQLTLKYESTDTRYNDWISVGSITIMV
jgi:hypothetical protein